jgi:hypothetical protein
VVVGIALGAAAAAIIAFYLAPFGAHAPRVPSGFDTPRYIWRSNIVTDHGFRALAEIHVPNQDPLAERAAYPIFAALVHATSGITPLRLAFVLPAVMAVTVRGRHRCTRSVSRSPWTSLAPRSATATTCSWTPSWWWQRWLWCWRRRTD